jgi:outer membrane lipoprotein SlyB
MKTKISVTLVAIALGFSSSAFAQYEYRRQTTVEGGQSQAVVIETTPTYESIVVGQNCQPGPASNYVAPVVGGAVGALVGSLLGRGNGRLVGVAAGAVGGTMLGQHYGESQPSRPQMHCTPVTKLQATGNAYIAEYQGRRFSGHTYRPLRTGDLVYVNTVTMMNAGE